MKPSTPLDFDEQPAETPDSPAGNRHRDIFSRVPGPRTFKPERSEILARVAAFLPGLAAANAALDAKKDNMETLTGSEGQVIELRLGLGVLEEQTQEDKEREEREASVAVLPSELAKKQQEAARPDPYTAILAQLLEFNSDSDDVEDATASSGSSAEDSADTGEDADRPPFLEFE